jgi:thioesterase domain-containing protein
MNAHALQAYLHEHIPLSAAMGTTVVEAGPAAVCLGAPLESNLNHRGTAFGGSVATLAILAGWALVHLRLRSEGVEARTVIQRSDVAYVRTIEGAFEARAVAPAEHDWTRFRSALSRWGRETPPPRFSTRTTSVSRLTRARDASQRPPSASLCSVGPSMSCPPG